MIVMTESTREQMARIVWQLRWGFDFDKAAKVAAIAPVAQEMIDEVYATVDAILDVLAEPSDGQLHSGAVALDHPSVYMGGPSRGNRRKAHTAWSAMIAAIRKGK